MDDVLPWPLMTIDFEASSLDEGTYPIEVGVCRWTSPDATIEGWSTLIAPIPAWCDHGSWSPSSQEVHGIKPEELAAGMSPTEAIAALNAITGGLRHSATAAVMTSIGQGCWRAAQAFDPPGQSATSTMSGRCSTRPATRAWSHG